MDFKREKRRSNRKGKLVAAYVDWETHAELMRHRQIMAREQRGDVALSEAMRDIMEHGIKAKAMHAYDGYAISHIHDKDETKVSISRLIYAWHAYFLGAASAKKVMTVDHHGMVYRCSAAKGATYSDLIETLMCHPPDTLYNTKTYLDELATTYACGKPELRPDIETGTKCLRELWAQARNDSAVSVDAPPVCGVVDPIGLYDDMSHHNAYNTGLNQ